MSEREAVALVPRFAPRIRPTPIPVSGVFDSPNVCVTINEHWVSHILGVLEALDQPDTWLGTDEEIFLARQQVRELALALRQGNCAEGTLFRQNPEDACILEASYDNGVTWETVADLSLCAPEPPEPKPPRTQIDDVRIGPVSGEPEVSFDGGTTWTPVDKPPNPWRPARSPSPGDTQEQQRCHAASLAVYNLSEMYEATYGLVAAGLANSLESINNFLWNLNDFLAGIVFGTYYDIAKAIGFNQEFEPTQYTAPSLSQEAQEALVCLLYDNATVGAYRVVSFDFNAIRDNVIGVLGINPGTAVWTHLNYLGEDGLNRLGEVGFGAEFDCTALCDGAECVTWRAQNRNVTLPGFSYGGGAGIITFAGATRFSFRVMGGWAEWDMELLSGQPDAWLGFLGWNVENAQANRLFKIEVDGVEVAQWLYGSGGGYKYVAGIPADTHGKKVRVTALSSMSDGSMVFRNYDIGVTC